MGLCPVLFLDLLEGEVVARQVQPGVEEHGAVAAREDESIAVEPLRILRVVLEDVGVEDGANLLGAKFVVRMRYFNINKSTILEYSKIKCGFQIANSMKQHHLPRRSRGEVQDGLSEPSRWNP